MTTTTGNDTYRLKAQDSDWTEERSHHNIGNMERLVTTIAGAAFLLAGISRRSLAGSLMSMTGTTLLYRGLSGYCPAYAALQARDSSDTSEIGRRKVPSSQAVKVRQSITIARPAESLYRFWRNMHNLPKIMSHVKSIEVKSPHLSHWVVDSVPGGPSIEWDAEIMTDVPNERIGWRSLQGSDVDHTGSVHFESKGPSQTTITVTLQYVPPAGKLGAAVARMLGEDPDSKIAEDLSKFKQSMEPSTVNR
jgi:uncharacterized membrane protein